MKTTKKIIRLFGDIIFLVLLVALDQLTKMAAVIELKDKPPFVIWEGVFELQYLENRGAAFGVLQNQKVFFVIITVIMLIGITYVLIKMPSEKMECHSFK